VTSDDGTLYALFVEHYQEYEMWLGEHYRQNLFLAKRTTTLPNQTAWAVKEAELRVMPHSG